MSTKKDNIQNLDHFYMGLALDLAKSKHGLTGVNPAVGCVLVKDNKIISIGSTGYGGMPHAESNAINFATENVQGSTMFVTLIPCCHYGKTPPCTNLIIKKKLKK
jgi:diaminohydroxyphosphoribosylaminopyrimidine deaminase/5-amino-6-(5-phosphoribosylamino)uracil reductase